MSACVDPRDTVLNKGGKEDLRYDTEMLPSLELSQSDEARVGGRLLVSGGK